MDHRCGNKLKASLIYMSVHVAMGGESAGFKRCGKEHYIICLAVCVVCQTTGTDSL